MANNSDLTFFTNEEGRTLVERFNKILNNNTQFFDVLVGYFRTSGFYMLEDAVKNVEKTRILVGINTDKQTFDMLMEAENSSGQIKMTSFETINQFKTEIINEFEESEDTKQVEEGVNTFIQLIKDKKLEIRVYPHSQIHSKLYIMRKDISKSEDYGKVITGSSNFSQNGLQNNLEFNVELKNNSDVEFALQKFEELWGQGVNVTPTYVDTVVKDTWANSDITPYEMYIKFLYEYFKEDINSDKESMYSDPDKYFPKNFRVLQYQRDAVLEAKRKLEAYNGVFISDVVGLGKTYICAMLAQELKGRILIICPPVLKDYWDSTMKDFNVQATVESLGMLDKIVEDEERLEGYKYVFIDESHKFRNASTESYKQLHTICYKKKVVLISATPQNNYSSDIANQIYLFQSKQDSTIIPNRKNIEGFFNKLNENIRKLEKGTDEYREEAKKISEIIRDKVLRNIMIRRTRSEIQKIYKEDLESQGLTFPKVNPPERLVYEFSDETLKIFEMTVNMISKISYSRYTPFSFVKEASLTDRMKSGKNGQMNMSGFMKGLMIKRLESSIFAFKQTLKRIIISYEKFIEMYNTGTIYISKKMNVFELLANDSSYILDQAVEKDDAYKLKSSDFENDFIINIANDLKLLHDIEKQVNNLNNDDKLKAFLEKLNTDKKLKNGKMIIFTESKETAEYLKENIENGIKKDVICYTGSSSLGLKDVIRANYDPNYKEKGQENKYNVLVTTDVLAEGINLHRGNIVINYDLPWNPTRVMQRVGRINRVGTKHSELYIYNFFPTAKSNEQISLEENIISKIQMFHDILGEDSKFLSDEEEISTHELFKKLNDFNEEENIEVISEMSYLKFIREIRDKQPELYEKVKLLPKKIKTAKKYKEKNSLITFFRKGYLKKFFKSDLNGNKKEIEFEEAINIIKSDENELKEKIPSEYYDLLDSNKKQFKELLEIEKVLEEDNKQGSKNAKQLLKKLKSCEKRIEFTDIELEKINRIIDLLDNGDLSAKVLKDGVKVTNKSKSYVEFYKSLVKVIPEIYLKTITKQIGDKEISNQKKTEVILSEYLV